MNITVPLQSALLDLYALSEETAAVALLHKVALQEAKEEFQRAEKRLEEARERLRRMVASAFLVMDRHRRERQEITQANFNLQDCLSHKKTMEERFLVESVYEATYRELAVTTKAVCSVFSHIFQTDQQVDPKKLLASVRQITLQLEEEADFPRGLQETIESRILKQTVAIRFDVHSRINKTLAVITKEAELL